MIYDTACCPGFSATGNSTYEDGYSWAMTSCLGFFWPLSAFLLFFLLSLLRQRSSPALSSVSSDVSFGCGNLSLCVRALPSSKCCTAACKNPSVRAPCEKVFGKRRQNLRGSRVTCHYSHQIWYLKMRLSVSRFPVASEM